ncbi:MAG: hypothetical protein WBG90_09820 [Saonia sp.]
MLVLLGKGHRGLINGNAKSFAREALSGLMAPDCIRENSIGL